MTGRIADPAGTEIEQPALEESRIVQSGGGPGEQNLERTDTEEERRLRGHGENDRTPGASPMTESDRRDRQHRQTHGLAGNGIEDVLSEPDEVGVGQIEPSPVEPVIPDSHRTGCD